MENLGFNNGNQQASYQSIEYVLKPYEVWPMHTPYNFFECLESDFPFDVAWATNRGATNFEKGLYVKFSDKELLPTFQITNGANPNRVVIAVGAGDFKDNRLVINNKSLATTNLGFANYTATSGSGASSLPYVANTQIDVLCTSGTITLDNAAGITALILNAGQSWSACLGVAGTLSITGSGSWNISAGSW